MQSPCPTFQYAGKHNGIDFWFSPECPVVDEAMAQVSSAQAPAAAILKNDGKRLLFVAGKQEVKRFVVKINLLPRWKDRLRAKQFAPEECQCHHRIAQLGIPVPALWGFFAEKRCGITRRNGLVIAFLEHYRNLGIDENNRAVPLLLALYEKGISHPDFMRNNIMVNDDTQEHVLIDLERSSFHSPRDLRIPVMNLARYIEYNERPLLHPDNQAMINLAYEGLANPPCSRDAFAELLAMLNSSHLSTRERVGLVVPDDVMSKLRQYCPQ